MPNNFTLTPKGASEPEVLQVVDEKMCAHFEQPCDPEKWFCAWYNAIGFAVAMGATLPQLIERYTQEYGLEDAWTQIAIWLNDNYTTDAWATIGRG